MALEEVMNQVRAFGCQLVEITGGEPLAQKEAFTLIKRLCDEGYEVLIETGGYVPTTEVDQRAKIILDVKCPASGEESRNHWPNLDNLRAGLDEVKFVVANRGDWEFAKGTIHKYQLDERKLTILISPAWNEVDLKDLAHWIVTSGINVRMQLQIHKYIWGAEARGV
jgi:7-carboxy-7-deazaguanine synthase